ncbi:substrate-binding periplasmic protein [Terasakiella pusilla]|uniref:substrate-binding periplasmic protein n=1 Tax=Terasakiella pusilla TaxID=64973 RepID=UPI003AA7B271
MIKQLTRIFSIVALMVSFANATHASDVAKIYTSFFSNVVSENPDRPGFGYELVAETFKLAGKDFEIIPLPWARAQYLVKNTPEALIFPLSWTPTRNAHYDWSLRIFSNHTHFIGFNKTKLTADSAHQKRIGVQLKSGWDNWLTEQGYQDVYRVPGDGKELIKLLRNDRIDAWYTDTIIGDYVIGHLDQKNFTYSDPIQTFQTYLATNRDVPYPHVAALKTAFKQLKDSGRLDEIFKKYNISDLNK